MFKWCLMVIYGEQEYTFYWKNFRKEVFETDKGKDFIERLKGLRFKLLTEHLKYAFDNIIERKAELQQLIGQNKGSTLDLQQLYQYIETIYRLNIEMETLKNLEAKQELVIY